MTGDDLDKMDLDGEHQENLLEQEEVKKEVPHKIVNQAY